MARRIVGVVTTTPTATADTVSLVDSTYPFIIQGGAATQYNRLWEVSISGQAASSSSPTFMLLSRDSTVAATAGTNQPGFTDAAVSQFTAALAAPALTGDAFTTKPQRGATLHQMNCSLNAFGGVYFWRANRAEECPDIYGLSANTGEWSLSAYTGGTPGAIGPHAIYESL
jgi:hypothetical protein